MREKNKVIIIILIGANSFPVEESMYAKLWKEDQEAKRKREEMEAALQIEKNREMLKVIDLTTVIVN